MQTNSNARRLIKYGILIFVALVLIIGVVSFFSNSWLTIKTPSASTEISVIKDGIVIQNLKGSSVFIPLTPGSYSISVRDGAKMSTKYIDAHGGQFHTYSFTLKELGQTQNITAVQAGSIFSSNSELRYIDTGDQSNGYVAVNADGIHRFANNLHFSQIQWTGDGKGIGLSSIPGTDETPSHVTSIVGNLVKSYVLPDGTQNKNQSVAIAPDGMGWFTAGDSLYREAPSGLTRIYQAKHEITVLAATDTAALVTEVTNADGDSQTMQLVSIKLDGSETRGSSFSFHADPNLSLSAAYSPDGSHIILTSMGVGIIYTNDLKSVEQLPLHTMVTSATWKDNLTVLYAAENNVLSYSLDTKTADAIGASEAGSTITGLFYNTADESVVVSVSGAVSSNMIERISLKSTKNEPSIAVKALISYLPREYTILSCRANYNTLNSPTVVIEQRVSSDNEQNARDCEDAVKQTFDQYKIDASQFTYIKLLP